MTTQRNKNKALLTLQRAYKERSIRCVRSIPSFLYQEGFPAVSYEIQAASLRANQVFLYLSKNKSSPCERCGKEHSRVLSVWEGFRRGCSRRCERELTCLERFGTLHPMKDPDIRQRQQRAMLRKYGSGSPLANPIVRKKADKTMQSRYGVSHPMHSEEIRKKLENTNLKRYGAKNPAQASKVISKIQQARYGRKELKLPSGKIFLGQGYELGFVKCLLSIGIPETQIVTSGLPTFEYQFEEKTHRYLPDLKFRTPYGDVVYVEVKSTYTAKIGRSYNCRAHELIVAKSKALLGKAYFKLVVMEGDRLLDYTPGSITTNSFLTLATDTTSNKLKELRSDLFTGLRKYPAYPPLGKDDTELDFKRPKKVA